MKFIPLGRNLIVGLSFILIIPSCGKDDGKVAYGYSYVYMPQSILQSGGTNNNYIVPSTSSGSDSATYNYIYDSTDQKINVILGVYRSGLEAAIGYSVTVKASTDTIASLIKSGTLSNGLALGNDMYRLPEMVTVSNGNLGTHFYLSLDWTKIKNYTGLNLAISVSISNPSRYSLDTSQATTIVIVNINKLHSLID